MDQVATLQMNMQQTEASFAKREKDWQMEQARVVALQTHDATHAKETIQALETKLGEKTAEVAAAQEALDEHRQRGTHALEQEQLKLHRLQGEKDSLTAKFNTTHELLTKMKAENQSWRAQHKEVEQEYRVLQTKHREAMKTQQDLQSLLDQDKAKIQFLEDDLAKAVEQRAREKDEWDRMQAQMKRHLDESVAAAFNARRSMKDEQKKAVDKLTKALTKVERKRDAYKEKCLQVHERYKAAAYAKATLETQVQQLKDQHHVDMQQFLTQWGHAEEMKTSAVVVGRTDTTRLDSLVAEMEQYEQTTRLES
ncbi:Aste57867_11747 [Aphanomyces stellatus]|uniref:Aste57867_11747 protein n=1 Tax=Aphanomyces stellatus TaxID=120398 RepID=A0A485KU22_9STRA|nr:hypothetical protein As57867_011702 [Aphanomyces stellatus]VFT88603.1 Aste57867_11747 [Aphanomyces stellatus]